MPLLPRVIYDNRQKNSLVFSLRRKRFGFFKSLIDTIPYSLNILDIGGTLEFWIESGFLEELLHLKDIQITLLNIEYSYSNNPHIKTIIGDATNLSQFKDREFDIVFSNSVIEHLFTYDNQIKMAEEIKRIGRRYFIQTPNKYFPIEPHFQFPLFQFLPLSIKIILIRNFQLGWRKKAKSKQKAIETVTEIRLLGQKELQKLFPGSKIYKEKFATLTKSLTAYDGW
ncbi:MAG: class I SAM-dependent methyltransferase [Cyanobacteria bacterium J06636_27]